MNTIVRTFMDTHIDLSKIVSISDAIFVDEMGHGGYFVQFSIVVQLVDKPIIYQRKFEYGDWDSGSSYSDRPRPIMGSDGKTPIAVERLQKQVEGLIEQWKNVQS